jgi:hypothetical protein
MAARLGLALAHRLVASRQSETPVQRGSKATSKLANVMSDSELNNIVRALQDAVTYPIRTRSARRAQGRPLPSKQPWPTANNAKPKQRYSKGKTI